MCRCSREARAGRVKAAPFARPARPGQEPRVWLQRERELKSFAHRSKTAAMFFAWTEALQRCKVFGRGVTLVPLESVARVARIEHAHVPVATDFCEDRRGHDRRLG